MEISINIDDSVPIFNQLIDQIKQAVAARAINPGDALPSIRQLANDLDINNKTVAKAYQRLERDNVIQAKGYRGTFVHPEARKHCTIDLHAWLDDKFEQVISEIREKGFDDSEIRQSFSKIMSNKG